MKRKMETRRKSKDDDADKESKMKSKEDDDVKD